MGLEGRNFTIGVFIGTLSLASVPTRGCERHSHGNQIHANSRRPTAPSRSYSGRQSVGAPTGSVAKSEGGSGSSGGKRHSLEDVIDRAKEMVSDAVENLDKAKEDGKATDPKIYISLKKMEDRADEVKVDEGDKGACFGGAAAWALKGAKYANMCETAMRKGIDHAAQILVHEWAHALTEEGGNYGAGGGDEECEATKVEITTRCYADGTRGPPNGYIRTGRCRVTKSDMGIKSGNDCEDVAGK